MTIRISPWTRESIRGRGEDRGREGEDGGDLFDVAPPKTTVPAAEERRVQKGVRDGFRQLGRGAGSLVRCRKESKRKSPFIVLIPCVSVVRGTTNARKKERRGGRKKKRRFHR